MNARAQLVRLGWCFGGGAAAGLLVGGVEAVHLVAAARRFFLSARELRTAVQLVLGIESGAGAVIGLVAGLVLTLAAVLGPKLDRDSLRGAARVIGASLVPLVGVSAWVLTAGPQARRIPGRAVLAALVALLAGATVAWALPRLAGFVAKPCLARRVSLALVSFALGAAFVVADARVLPRLYPVMHAWLGAAGIAGMAGALFVTLRSTRVTKDLVSLAFVLFGVVALVMGGRAVVALLATQNARSVLADRAPGVGRGLAVLARVGVRAPSAQERIVALTPELVEELAPRRSDTTQLPPLDVSDRDLLLVTVDALRADHLGAYGYDRPTSPRIDALAQDSVVFERAYTATPQTSYAVASLLTGKYVRSLFRLDQPPSNETLAHMLRERGMSTAAFFTDAVFFIDRDRFAAFEEDRFGFEYNKMHPVDAHPRLAQVREYLSLKAHDDRLFVWVHFFEPHEPYVPHAGHSFGDRDIDRYDGEIAETDAAVGELVEMMRARGREPIVVLTADHGEEFGDHGGRYHGSTLYEEQVRVPLVMRIPGVAPRRVSTPVQTVDIVPTLLGLYSVPWSARVRGTDLRPLLWGRPLETRVFADGIGARMMVVGNEKLICDEEQGLCQLFDLAADPHERQNLADREPARVAELRRTLSAWAASHARFERVADASSGHGEWPEAIRRAQLGDEGARAETVELLRSAAEPRVRAKAAEVLGTLGGPDVAVALAAALQDSDASVQAMASLSLLEAGDDRGIPGARRLAADEQVPAFTRHRAILALGAHGDAGAAPALRALAADAQAPSEVRTAAIGHLGRLRDRTSVPLLVAQMEDVRQKLAIVRALAAIGDPRGVPSLRRTVVSDPYDTVRSAAAKGLLVLGDRGGCAALRHALSGREPVVGALESLVGLGCAPALPARPPAGWRCTATGCAPPPAGGTLPLPASGRPSHLAARRLVVRWTATGDGGRLLLGGQAIDVVAGVHETSIDLPTAAADVAVSLDPPDLGVTLQAVLVVRVEQP